MDTYHKQLTQSAMLRLQQSCNDRKKIFSRFYNTRPSLFACFSSRSIKPASDLVRPHLNRDRAGSKSEKKKTTKMRPNLGRDGDKTLGLTTHSITTLSVITLSIRELNTFIECHKTAEGPYTSKEVRLCQLKNYPEAVFLVVCDPSMNEL